jgi:hypothetical protein
MNKEFVPYDIALAMEELGFDEHCFGFYNQDFTDEPAIGRWWNGKAFKKSNHCLAPLYQQAFRWFREKGVIPYRMFEIVQDEFGFYTTQGSCKTYEEAQDQCLRKLIEIIKDEKSN